jgi:hypothetical protein
MRILVSLFGVALVALMLVGCGGSKEAAQTTGDVPDWFTNPPQDPNYLFAANTATSQDLQLAIDKAVTGARTEIGRQMEVKVNGLQKKFEEETGVGQDAQLLSQFTSASKTVVSTQLSGSRIKFQKQLREGNLWRAYVLMEYPIGAASEAMMKAIKANNQMYTRFRASEAYKDLDKEVEKYEEFKKQQAPTP